MEIYNEKIFDLLDANCTGLQLREDMKKGVMVRNLQELPVENPDEACEVLKVGGRNRRVATTSMNRESSRSHAVFTVTVKSVEIKGDVTNVRESRLNLIDLAGSERQRDTNAEGKRLKEAGSINKSLSALGNVIKALVDIEQGKQRHVAYRDSKLTFLLRDSLGGNTKTFMIANISPAARAFGETLSTLQFAARAKMIKNKAKINEDVSGDVAALRTQIKQLKAQLASGGGGSMAVPAAIMAGDGNLDHMNKLIMGAMASRARAEQEKALLAQQLKATEEALKKKDNQCRSEKMIVKFRNKSLEMAEKKLKGQVDAADLIDAKIKDLEATLKQLKENPEMKAELHRFASENIELRTKIKHLKEAYPNSAADNAKIAELQEYTLTLEDQWSKLQASGGASGSKLNPHPLTPSKVVGKGFMTPVTTRTRSRLDPLAEGSPRVRHNNQVELEKFKMQKQLEEKISTLKAELKKKEQAGRDLMRLAQQRETEVASEIAALTKSLSESEHVIKSQQMRANMEMVKLKDEHMERVGAMNKSTEEAGALTLEISALRMENEKAVASRDEAEAQSRKTQQDKVALESKAEALASQMALLETSHAEAVERLQNELEVAEDNVLAADETTQQAKTEAATKKEDANKFMAMVAELTEEMSDRDTFAQKEVARLEAEASQANTDLLRVRDTLESERTEFGESQDELETLRATSDYKDQQISQYEGKVSSLADENAGLKTALQDQQATFAQELEMAKPSEEAASASAGEIRRLQAAGDDQASKIAKLEEDLAAVTAESASAKQHIEDQKAQLDESAKSTQTLKGELEGLKDAASSTEQELKECLDKIASMTASSDAQVQAAEEAQARIEGMEAELEEESAAHKEEKASWMAELDKSQSQLRAKERETAAAISKVAAHEASLEMSQDEIEYAQECTATAHTEVATLKSQITAMETRQAEATEASNDATQAQLAAVSAELASNKAKLKEFSDMLEIGEKTRAEKNAEIAALKEKLETYKESDAQLSSYKEKLSAAETTLAAEKQACDAAVSKATAAESAMYEELDGLRKIYNEASTKSSSSAAKFDAERASFKNRIAMLEINLDSALEDAEALVDQLTLTQTSENEAIAAKDDLHSRLEQLQEENMACEGSLEQRKIEVEKLQNDLEKATGHNNLQQKIQLHLKVKRENNSLREEVAKLTAQLKKGGKGTLAAHTNTANGGVIGVRP